MTTSKQGLESLFLVGTEEWKEKIKDISELGLSKQDFYTHLRKEVNELLKDRNDDEMCDVINTLAMVYVIDDYDVSLRDCYDKLKRREEKYEIKREKP